MRAERDALFGELAQFAERENLKATGIGEHRAVPRHEAMESTKFANVLVSGPKIKMVGIAENNLRTKFFEDVLRDGLYGRNGSDGHEDGRFDDAMRQLHAADTGLAVAGFDCERERHGEIVAKGTVALFQTRRSR